jgi:TalC/MipB family fructose-6-phosphate aldolase
MEIWLDTCDIEAIDKANRLGILYGVTTNPSILANADDDHDKVIQSLLDAQDGPIAVQVTACKAEEMIRQAMALHSVSDRIIVKIPVIQEGLIAIKALSEENVPVMATAVFHSNQALLAAIAGADYVAPYISRMIDEGIDAYASVQMMAAMYQTYRFKTKILGAALRTTEQITICASLGIAAVTMKSVLFSQFIADDKGTLNSLRAFAEEWDACEHQTLAALT